jgi:hypothetical protein
MKSGFTKRTVVDTRKQLADLGQLTPIKVHVSGSSPKGYLVRSKDLFSVHCKHRGEVHVVLEILKDLALVGKFAPQMHLEIESRQKSLEDDNEERQSWETVHKLIEYINQHAPLMCLAAIPTGPEPGSDGRDPKEWRFEEIDLITQSNTRTLAKFSTWYKCLIYLKGMVEMINTPIPKF